MVEKERKSVSDWNGGVKKAEGRGRTCASEAAVIPHSRISVTWQHLRDNTSDPVARFQLAGCVQQLRWKGSHVFTEPQGCLITAWKQEALPTTKTGARTHREHQGPAGLSPSLSLSSLKSPSHLCRPGSIFFPLSFSHFNSLVLKSIQQALLHTVALPVCFTMNLMDSRQVTSGYLEQNSWLIHTWRFNTCKRIFICHLD